uniref:Uncharacterized protein n=1 Tax=Lepeophtheirus salmonis TaxID=72036 RepID=A0A0K2TPA6_LEPSM
MVLLCGVPQTPGLCRIGRLRGEYLPHLSFQFGLASICQYLCVVHHGHGFHHQNLPMCSAASRGCYSL